MSAIFEVITEEFNDDISSVEGLVRGIRGVGVRPRERIVAANAATLFLAALFEEYVRQMARECARFVVYRCRSPDDLPKGFKAALWRRTMQKMQEFDAEKNRSDDRKAVEGVFRLSLSFCNGDLWLQVFDQLIHNENNMRSKQLNALFKLSGLNDTCKACAHRPDVQSYFDERNPERVSGLIVSKLEEFMERRNSIAHSLDMNKSSAPAEILEDARFLSSFSKSLLHSVHSHIFPANAEDAQKKGIWLLNA